MKSEERHKLKSNQLAESIEGIPDYLRVHGKRLFTSILIVVLVVVGLVVFRNSRLAAQDSQAILLQSLVAETKAVQRQAVQKAQSGEKTDDLLVESYGDSAQSLENSFADLSQNSSGSHIAKTASLQKARILRSRLFYTDTPMSQEKREGLLSQIEAVYNTVLLQSSNDVMSLGAAKIGLALVAEDRLQWDQARLAYQAILDDAQGQWAGTIFPSQASQRLEAINEIEGESAITFEWVADVPEVDSSQDEAISEVVEEVAGTEPASSPEDK